MTNPPKPILADTGERFIPGHGDVAIHLEHVQRYWVAAGLISAGAAVLDYGCGSGYGAQILGARAARVVAVDISEVAIGAARQWFAAPNVDFRVISSGKIPLPDASVDLITCFEVIEHTSDQDVLVREFARVLKPTGLLLISTPERRLYSDQRGYRNPFHVRELTFEEFDTLLATRFSHRRFYRQRFSAAALLLPRDRLEREPCVETTLRFGPWSSGEPLALPEDTAASPMYYVAVVSPRALPEAVDRLACLTIDELDAFHSSLSEEIQRLTADVLRTASAFGEQAATTDRLHEDAARLRAGEAVLRSELHDLRRDLARDEVALRAALDDNARLDANARYLSELSALQQAQIERFERHPALWLVRMGKKSARGLFFLLTNWGEFRQRWRLWKGGRSKSRDRSSVETVSDGAARGAPLVSVILPVFDRTTELRQSIESILSQTCQDFELLIVCDGSPPATLEVIGAYRAHPKVRIIRYLDNSGNACRGRNRGIKEARGEFVAFQDSDDIATPDRLEASVQHLRQTDVDVVYGAFLAVMDGSRRIDGLTHGQRVDSPDCDLETLLRHNVPVQSTVLARTEALRRAGGFKPLMRYCEDYELWLRLAAGGARFRAVPRVLTHLRLHDGNLERRFEPEAEQWRQRARAEYVRPARLSPIVGYFIPGEGIGGGIAVICQHTNRLLRAGLDVLMINVDDKDPYALDWFPDQRVPIVTLRDRPHVDIAVATGWSTAGPVAAYPAGRRCYFVQSDESRFFPEDRGFVEQVRQAYRLPFEYLTEARWIQRWLHDEYGHEATLVPNGLDPAIHRPVEPLVPRGRRLRVLLEGPIDVPYKGMADAFAALRDVDCEVWRVSSAGRPQPGWRCDRFFERARFSDMAAIYSSCDVLLKLSRVEGFFGPPLEMMACGGTAVVGEVTGCDEYIVDGQNALVVPLRDVEAARRAVQRLIEDPALRRRLTENGAETAAKWRWEPTIERLRNFFAPDSTAQDAAPRAAASAVGAARA